jgi:hypothetical protein
VRLPVIINNVRVLSLLPHSKKAPPPRSHLHDDAVAVDLGGRLGDLDSVGRHVEVVEVWELGKFLGLSE